MDKQLRKLMRQRQEARTKLTDAHVRIINYVASELSGHFDEVRAAQLREAYVVGHLAETLADMPDFDAAKTSIDQHVRDVLSKKGYATRGSSTDRRTKDEERAYGNAREAWSYIMREAGLR